MCFSLFAEAAPPAAASEPRMRAVDRDWSFFRELPCDELEHITVQSEREQQLLKRRRQECLERYRAFLPEPVAP